MTASERGTIEQPTTLSMQRSDHSGLTPQEIGDRLAIRELVDAYAHCADRRDVKGQMFLFTADTEFLVYMDGRNAVPTQEIRGRDGLRPVFENLSTYEATTHFNCQSTVTWAPDSARGSLTASRITSTLTAPVGV